VSVALILQLKGPQTEISLGEGIKGREMEHANRTRVYEIVLVLLLVIVLGTLYRPSAPVWAQSPRDQTPHRLDFDPLPVDLSFLNATERPAGKHGFLRIESENLVFTDGTKVRFWGTNITGRALFLSAKEDVQRQARRLARMGFNLVRIHHHDAEWVKPNIFGDQAEVGSKRISESSLARLDWLIKCLEDEGIYVWLDLYDSRLLKASDKIEAFSELAGNGIVAELQGYNFVNESIERAMMMFDEQLLTHVNIFTGIRYLDDPGFAAVLIANENDITHHFGSRLLLDKNVPFHTALFMAAAGNFAARHGYRLEKVWRTWQPGVSNIFLNDLEHSFYARMAQHLRSLGVKIPIIATSQWGGNTLSSLPSLTSGDIIDAHAYGGPAELSKDPHQVPNMASDIGAARVNGFPLSVSEWNVSPFPVADRHVIPIYLAAIASYQGWSALMQYAYTQRPLSGVDFVDNWEGARDPSLIASLPAAALLYRRGDVKPARTSYVFAPSAELFSAALTPATSLALRTAFESGRLSILLPKVHDLPWLEPRKTPAESIVFSDPNTSFLETAATQSVSDTGELSRNWRDGVFTINTPFTQAAAGNIGGRTLKLGDTEIRADTTDCTVVVQSIDSNPIASSGTILISLGGHSAPLIDGHLPFSSERVFGTISVKAKPGLSLYTLVGEGVRRPTSFSLENSSYRIKLSSEVRSSWLLLNSSNP